MLAQFHKYVEQKRLFSGSDKILLAFSGGVDSVVLMNLLLLNNFDFAIAHCNFGLRGEESDEDERFCRQVAEFHEKQFYCKKFDTAQVNALNGLGIQANARNLRYQWFAELAERFGYDYILTAHHANDQLETVLLNLVRGTGLNGLKGISEKQGRLLRPLLPFTRAEIEEYARDRELPFRTDSSNNKDHYDRNFIRLNVIPLLKQLNPSLEHTMLANIGHFRQAADIVQQFNEQVSQSVVSERTANSLKLDKLGLKHLETKAILLHSLLQPFGFNTSQVQQISEGLENGSEAGALFFSRTHRLNIGQKEIVVEKKAEAPVTLKFRALPDLLNAPFYRSSILDRFEKPDNRDLLIAQSRLIFPVTVRNWQHGDKFKPFGMDGFKLVSDFLREQKLNSFERERCRVMVNGNGEIIWVQGLRSDDRYKVNENEPDLIRIRVIE